MGKKNYEIIGKSIIADIPNLTEKELQSVKNYVALGYELKEGTPHKPTKAERAEQKKQSEEKKAEAKEAQKQNPYSKQNVEAFLNQAGNEELLAEYTSRYNEQAGTNRKGQENEPKFLKDGTPKKKGFANCIGWFTDKFTWDETTKTYIRNTENK